MMFSRLSKGGLRWQTIRKCFSIKMLCPLTAMYMMMFVTLIYYCYSNTDTVGQNPASRSLVDRISQTVMQTEEDMVQFALVACKDDKYVKNHPRSHWDHQLRQISVLLKSVAVLSSKPIYFNLVVNSPEVYQDITNLTSQWPEHYKKQVVFKESREIFYPPGLEHMRNMFCVCATGRLFLPQVYPDLDAVIFIDTDTMFMQPPEDLWPHFRNFERRHFVGVTPCLYLYCESWKKIPKFGFTGLNSGVLLMNLTRLKDFPGGWIQTIGNVTEKYKGRIPYADQDILNIIFSGKVSSNAYEVPCEWNFRIRLCSEDRMRCPTAPSNGVALFHGCAETFVNDKAPRIKAIFEAWDKYNMTSPVQDLLSSMEQGIRGVKSSNGCSQIDNIEDVFLKGFKRTLCTKYNMC